MNIQEIQVTDLDQQQLVSVINKSMNKAKKELDKFIEMDVTRIEATFDLAAKVHQMQMMMLASELGQEIRTFTKLCELQAAKETFDSGVDIDDEEAVYEVAKDVIHQQRKYCALNNETLVVMLFELSKDILTEGEFISAIF